MPSSLLFVAARCVQRRTRLFAGDSTPKSRHGGPGVEIELFGAIAELQRIAGSTNGAFSMVDLAMGWLLAQPGVSCLLVGASTVGIGMHLLAYHTARLLLP